MGLARALAAQGCKEEAAVAAERFASFGVRPHTDDELAVLAGIGDALFEFGARVRSRPIYEVLRAFAPPSRKVTVRLAESSIADRRLRGRDRNAAPRACRRAAGVPGVGGL